MTHSASPAPVCTGAHAGHVAGLAGFEGIQPDPGFDTFCKRSADYHAEIASASARSRARRLYPLLCLDARWDWALRREIWFVRAFFSNRKRDRFSLGSFKDLDAAQAALAQMSCALFGRGSAVGPGTPIASNKLNKIEKAA